MKIVLDINHPAHVHIFRNFLCEMKERGHEFLILASEKDLTYSLLENYGIPFVKIRNGKTLLRKIGSIPLQNLQILKAVAKFNPDLFLGAGSIRAAHVSFLLRRPCISFDDDEYSYPYYHFFVGVICGFSGFKKRGPKIIKIDSYKEMAYLHPNYFTPNPQVLEKIGISPYEKYCIVRFVSWTAFHDIGKKGFDDRSKLDLIKYLSERCTVYISSEAPLPESLQKYQLKISPEHIHDLLYYATLLISDSQTMTTESAILGTPAIRCNSFVGEHDMGNFVELEQDYGLIFNFNNSKSAIDKALALLNDPVLKTKWAEKRKELLRKKIDVTPFMVWFIENFPHSFSYMKNKQSEQSI